MQNSGVNILMLASIMQTWGKELALNHNSNLQDSIGGYFDKMSDHLLGRMLSAHSPHRLFSLRPDLDDTTLGKAGHLARVPQSLVHTRPTSHVFDRRRNLYTTADIPHVPSFHGRMVPTKMLHSVIARANKDGTDLPQVDFQIPYDTFFSGIGPESKAAEHLQRFFTFIAVRIVLGQIGGERHTDLTNFYHKVPMQDADEWLEKLLLQDYMLAARIMEVRRAYGEEEFEWDRLQKNAMKRLEEGNHRIMHKWLKQAYPSLYSAAEPQSNADVPQRREDGVEPARKMPASLPFDVFGGASPESKAAEYLQRFFTYIAIKIVQNEIEGQSHADLTNFYENEHMHNADEWLEKFMSHDKLTAVRIMEVRRQYADGGHHGAFEWDWLHQIALKKMDEGNAKVMRKWMVMQYDTGVQLNEPVAQEQAEKTYDSPTRPESGPNVPPKQAESGETVYTWIDKPHGPSLPDKPYGPSLASADSTASSQDAPGKQSGRYLNRFTKGMYKRIS